MSSFKDIYKSLPKSKNRNSSIFVRYFIRPISIFFSIPFINLGVTPNMVSYISFFIAIIGIIVLYYSFTIGSVILILWLIMDCVDGNIARFKHIKSKYGDFIDSLSSFFIIIFITPILTLNVVKDFEVDIIRYKLILYSVIIAALISFSRLIYQKYRVATLESNEQTENIPISKIAMRNNISRKDVLYIANRIEKNFGISGFLFPLIITAELLSYKYELLILYFIYGFLSSIMTIILILFKVQKSEKGNDEFNE